MPEAFEVGGIDGGRCPLEHADAIDLVCRLRLDRQRRKNEANSENDREPDPPHEHLVRGWLAAV